MREIVVELERLRRQSRVLLILQRLAVLVAWILGVAGVAIGIDFLLRLPSAFRLVMLAGGLVALVWAIVRYFLPALGFRPSLTQVALRVESAMPALTGRLASSVEFASSGLDTRNMLAARTVRDAQARLEGESIKAIIRPGRTVRDFGVLAVVAGLLLAAGIAAPASARTGITRLLLPYSSAMWPARTMVGSLMSEVLTPAGVHPRGQALPLRAVNQTKGDPTGRVEAHYRLDDGNGFGAWQNVLLTHQADAVHERLIDTNAAGIELYFATEDAQTALETIRFVPPPAIVRATLTVTPPAYAAGTRSVRTHDLGPGLDARAVTEEPSLRGSGVVLEVELNKPLPVPTSEARAAWITRTLGWPDAPPPSFEVVEDTRWRASWTLETTTKLPFQLEDEYGLENREPIQYQITAVDDLPPSVTITEPAIDQTALPNALVSIAGEAKDDVGVDRLSLVARRKRDDASEPTPLPLDAETLGRGPVATVEAELDLAPLELVEGDIVFVHAEADDIYERDGDRHPTMKSATRRIRIISELDLAAQLRRQLSAVRQNAMRIELAQSELQDDVEQHGPQPGLKRAQAELADRIADQRESVEELQEQLDRNRMDDPSLSELIQQSQDLLDYAGRAANQAAEAVEQREQKAESGEDEQDEPESDESRDVADPEDREILDAQQEVRDELSDLIELLDRDEDTWIVERQLEALREAQQQLQEATDQLADETIGQSTDDLTEAQLSELERIAQRQRELRDQVRRLLEEMRRRAEALEEMDPQAASGMRAAADTGERREVDQDMETAADQAEQNQLRSASASQQAAQQTLDRMNEDLQATRQARAEELLRQLASLIESIDRLIVLQENELIALARAGESGDFSGRDRAMIRLNQNTQAVAVDARAAGQASRRIARTLDRAADAQGAAVGALRAAAVEFATIREAEERSLAMLQEARKLADELQEETQEDQIREQREALMEAYRALAEKQVALRGQTLPLAELESLTRRQLVEARRLGNVQQEIRTALSDLEATTQDITNSDVFSFVHRLLDRWSSQVSDALWEGTVDDDVTDRQKMIADAIARQIEALEESTSPPEEFTEENAGAGGGGGAGPPPPLIPPVAEVKRLHGLQEQIYEQTRDIDAREDLPAARRRQRVRELGSMQREVLELGEQLMDKVQGGGPPADADTPPADTPPEGEPNPSNDAGEEGSE